MEEILSRHPDARIRVLVLWAPYLQHDSSLTAQRAAAYLSDRRATDFWDLWRFGSRVYSEEFKIPALDAWDMFVFYKPGITWQTEAPTPTFWLQNRHLEQGIPYSKETLEEKLSPWLSAR